MNSVYLKLEIRVPTQSIPKGIKLALFKRHGNYRNTVSRAGQESVKSRSEKSMSAEIPSGEGVLKHVEVEEN